jgi:hypothetical protein
MIRSPPLADHGVGPLIGASREVWHGVFHSVSVVRQQPSQRCCGERVAEPHSLGVVILDRSDCLATLKHGTLCGDVFWRDSHHLLSSTFAWHSHSGECKK